jgi:glycosyltransferase involved in cell wall biosynthesis
MDPMVKVIVPAFNSSSTIKRTIDSILAQTYPRIAVIVVDDCSTDNTLQILQSYGDRIFLLSNETNSGPSASRNKALQYTDPKIDPDALIAYCDSDDWWEPTHIAENVSYMEAHNVDFVYSKPEWVSINGEKVWPVWYVPQQFELDAFRRSNFIWISTVTHKPRLGEFDSTVNALEDWDLWIKAVEMGWKFEAKPTCTAHYLVKPNGMAGQSGRILGRFREKHASFLHPSKKFSIVIPTYNHCDDLLKPCLESVLQYTDLNDVEIIVVANGCTDNTRAYLADKPVKLVWSDQALGYTKATNEGIKTASGEFIILLNNDTKLTPQEKNAWIKMLYDPFVHDSKTGVTGTIKLWDPHTRREFLIFFCAMIRRQLFAELGLLDEAFSPGGGEDTDFCIKAENAGYKLVQVPSEQKELKGNMWVSHFPIYHMAEGTMNDNPAWPKIIDEHRHMLAARYGLPDGWFYDNDIAEYRRLVSEIPDGGSLCELGVWMGRSLCSVADLIRKKNIKVTAVDTFQGTVNEPRHSLASQQDLRRIFEDNLKRFGITANIHQMTTDEASKIVTGPFDLIFIDADHAYEAVKIDIANWKDKGRKLCGHDYGTWASVTQAVNESIQKVRVGGSVWSSASGYHIAVSLCTRDRHYTTLPMAMASMATQTRQPDFVYIYNDSTDPVDIRTIPTIRSVLKTYDQKGIGWYIIYGKKQGQHFGDQEINTRAHGLVFRFDDDCVAEPDVLEKLEQAMTDDVGAVACTIINPEKPMFGVATGKLANIRNEPNIQWVGGQGEVEHLHSCFLYRSHVANFDLRLSPRSFRGETMFSHEIMRKGYKLKVINTTKIWHYQNSEGGDRAKIQNKDDKEMYFHDDRIFNKWMRIDIRGKKLYVLNNGLGDHYMFLQTIKPDKKTAVIACCYPDLFAGYEIISIAEAHNMVDVEAYNIYGWCGRNNWKGSIADAFKEFYK